VPKKKLVFPSSCFFVAAVVLVALLMTGCQGLATMQGRPDTGLSFSSPLPPLENPVRDSAALRKVLDSRAKAVRSVRARANIVVGSGRDARQRFEGLIFVEPGQFLRMRATQSGATVFDLLVKDQTSTLIVLPDRTVYRGRLLDLERDSRLTAGISPRLLLDVPRIEEILRDRFASGNIAVRTANKGRLTLTADDPHSGETEIFTVRSVDGLVERYRRLRGRRKLFEVRFWSYEDVDGCVVPTRFAVENAAGGAILVTLSEVQLNQPRTAALETVEVPEGFAVRQLRAQE